MDHTYQLPEYITKTDVYQTGLFLVETLTNQGFESYFAGGAIRDCLLGRIPKDWDIATSATSKEISGLFNKTIETGAHFGSICVIENGGIFQVSTFRRDGSYIDGRHPSIVCPGTIEEDANRRDFTINGLFYDPRKSCIKDFVNGMDDIKNQIIKAIGNPHQRFQEDKLRIIRAIRFYANLGFSMDQQTESEISKFTTELIIQISKGENPR